MLPFSKGQFRARLAQSPGDIRAAQRLRYLAFRAGRPDATAAVSVEGEQVPALDRDLFDDRCQHLLIETVATGAVLGTCRFLLLRDPDAMAGCYAAQYYDLAPLSGAGGPLLEIGRFCLAPEARDPDVLRLIWAALTRIVDANAVTLMFGCSSFSGVNAAAHEQALILLASHHIGPERQRPRRQAAEIVPLQAAPHDLKLALAQMPPLLRSYLAMGGWVSDHAVVDRDLDTLHVFTAVEIARIPPARARLLRDDAR